MTEFETVWSGDFWRALPQPVVARTIVRPASTPETRMARLWDVLTGRLQSRHDIQARARMSPARVTEYLNRLVAQGRVEHKVIGGGKGRRGRGQHFYRRAGSRDVAA